MWMHKLTHMCVGVFQSGWSLICVRLRWKRHSHSFPFFPSTKFVFTCKYKRARRSSLLCYWVSSSSTWWPTCPLSHRVRIQKPRNDFGLSEYRSRHQWEPTVSHWFYPECKQSSLGLLQSVLSEKPHHWVWVMSYRERIAFVTY